MIYRSNLTAPDLTPLFAEILRDPPKTIMGHDAPSHRCIEPECTFWTHDEAAILFNVVASIEAIKQGSSWADIGSRFGWTGSHISAGQTSVMKYSNAHLWLVDPLYMVSEAAEYVTKAISSVPGRGLMLSAYEARLFFKARREEAHRFDGFVIDGNHDSPEPLLDAEGALGCAQPDCVILFHDFYGAPIRDAVRFLMNEGFKCRVYWTPNGVACCWRGFQGWLPPFHHRDPSVDWGGHMHNVRQDFNLGACL